MSKSNMKKTHIVLTIAINMKLMYFRILRYEKLFKGGRCCGDSLVLIGTDRSKLYIP